MCTFNTSMISVIVAMYLFGKNVYISQSAMMSKIFPHASFQSSLKGFYNTGFAFRIFSCEEMHLLSFQEILKFFIFEFSSFICL